MNLPNGWSARFDDLRHRVLCRKSGVAARKITLAWTPPHVKAIDPTSGTLRLDEAARLPPHARAAVVAECERRWSK